MLLKSFPLLSLVSLGHTAQLLRGSTAPSSPLTTQTTRVHGTLTSFSVIEGSGCPAGTYTTTPITPGVSLNTAVDFDAAVFLYNSTTSTAPVTCTLSIDFEFTYPEDGQAEIILDSVLYNDARFEQGDTNRTTNFNVEYDLQATAGADEIAVSCSSNSKLNP